MKPKQILFSADIKAIAEATAECIIKMEDKVLTLADMAAKLGKTEEAVKKLAQKGKIPYHKLDKTYYFSDRETTEYLLNK